jgi:hypothetical protein
MPSPPLFLQVDPRAVGFRELPTRHVPVLRVDASIEP